jgi:hypothetical protein
MAYSVINLKPKDSNTKMKEEGRKEEICDIIIRPASNCGTPPNPCRGYNISTYLRICLCRGFNDKV